MNRQSLTLTGVLATLATASLASTALANAHGNGNNGNNGNDRPGVNFSIPIVGLNNPCTPGHDSIDGHLDVNAVLKQHGDAHILTVRAKGDAVDAEGVDYDAFAKLRVKIHDPYPAHLFLQAKLIRDKRHAHHGNDGWDHGNGNGNGNGNGDNGNGGNNVNGIQPTLTGFNGIGGLNGINGLNGNNGGIGDNGNSGNGNNGFNGNNDSNGDWRHFWRRGGDDDRKGHKGRRDDAVLNAVVHVNEHGNVTKVDVSGIECRVIDHGHKRDRHGDGRDYDNGHDFNGDDFNGDDNGINGNGNSA